MKHKNVQTPARFADLRPGMMLYPRGQNQPVATVRSLSAETCAVAVKGESFGRLFSAEEWNRESRWCLTPVASADVLAK